MHLDLMKYLAGGAALGFVAGFWEKIKAVLWRGASLFVQRVEINTDFAHNALVSYLVVLHRRSRLYDRIYGAWHEAQGDGRCTLVERSDGVFTIITTNDLSRIDPALGQPRRLPDGTVEFISTRPGRLDKAIELTYMEVQDKRDMALRILGDYPEEYAQVLEFIERYPELQETPAQFQERCAPVALRCFWSERNATPSRRVVADALWPMEVAERM